MNLPSQSQANHSTAFTLIEILVVVGIIVILAALAFPVLNKAMNNSASAKAISNFKQISLANNLYSADNDGQLLGWGRYSSPWEDQVFHMRNLNLYLNNVNVPGNSDAACQEIGKGLAPFVDPLVPKANIYYLSTKQLLPFTWAINTIFNRANGRYYQYGSAAGWSTALNPRRITEFDRPANTIYAVSGGFEFSQATAADATLLPTTFPEDGSRPSKIFYLYGKNDTTIAVFLDGHAELVKFPIPADKIIPTVN